jgi:hypothetical protein
VTLDVYKKLNWIVFSVERTKMTKFQEVMSAKKSVAQEKARKEKVDDRAEEVKQAAVRALSAKAIAKEVAKEAYRAHKAGGGGDYTRVKR